MPSNRIWIGICRPPPNIATVISVGGEDGKPSSLPDWFPQVNLEGLSESIKAQ